MRIKEAILKCAFLREIEVKQVGMSKAMRDYLRVDTISFVFVEPHQAGEQEETGLSYLEVEAELKKPKGQNPTLNEDLIITELRKKEQNFYFNPG